MKRIIISIQVCQIVFGVLGYSSPQAGAVLSSFESSDVASLMFRAACRASLEGRPQ